MLGDAHAVDDDDAARLPIDPGGSHQLVTAEPRASLDCLPRRPAQVLGQRLDPLRVALDELAIENARLIGSERGVVGLDRCLHQPLDDGEVAPHPHLKERAADRRRRHRRHLNGALGRLEPFQGALAEGIERENSCTAPGCLAKVGHHAGAVGPGVLTEDEDRIGLIEVLEEHRSLADADRVRQPDARRLVAHVRAVGKVVRSVLARKELEEECSLVGSAARCVEFCLVGCLHCIQAKPDPRKSLLPFDGAIAVCARIIAHRMGEPPLHLKLVVAPSLQLLYGVRGEEVGSTAQRGCLPGDGFRTVLAELEG
jgi:hypothetical protein